MGADFYETPEELAAGDFADLPPVGIGAGSVIDGAIVDKNCRIGPGAQIINHAGVEDGRAGELCEIRDGILCVAKDTTLPAGWQLLS